MKGRKKKRKNVKNDRKNPVLPRRVINKAETDFIDKAEDILRELEERRKKDL
jgi:hypothetical protein